MVTTPEIQLKFLKTRQSFGGSKQFTQFSFLDLTLNLSKMKGKKTINHHPLKKNQHKNKALQDTETDGACQHLLQLGKKEFIMEALKQV